MTSDGTSGRGQELYRRARQLIPGGTQLLSKRPEMFAPEVWPAYYKEARGCEVTDLDGGRYIDMSISAVGSCLLGYADPDVNAAVVARLQAGSMCTLNNPEEVELAELLIELHPWAEQVRYARTGGEAMAIAVRIARAASGRDVVAFCGYHGWHDWYLSTNHPTGAVQRGGGQDADALGDHLLEGLVPSGVPRALAGTARPFHYNRLDELEAIAREYDGRLGAVVLETTRSEPPVSGFLEGVRALCDRFDIPLVVDEITIGWRLRVGGAHLNYGLEPDVAVFAKGLGNGFPMAAVIGRARIMEAAQGSFVSSTYWSEGVGPTAALATVRKMRAVNLPAHLERIGTRFQEGLKAAAERVGLPLRVGGLPAVSFLGFDHPDEQALLTLYTQRMLKRGFLVGGGFHATYGHRDEHVDAFLAAVTEVFRELAEATRQGDVAGRLVGPIRHRGFQRLAQ